MKTLNTWHTALAIAVAALTLPASAAAPVALTDTGAVATTTGDAALPTALGLAEFLALVQTHHPALRGMPLRQRMDEADVQAAGTWANPSVHVARQPGEREWGIEQPVPVFGQPGLRREAAQLNAQTSSATMRAELHATLHDAAQRFAELLAAQEKLHTQQQGLRHLDEALRVVQGQIALGARSRYDGVRVQLQHAQMQAQLAQQAAETQAARAALAQLLGRPDWQPQALGHLQTWQDAANHPSPALLNDTLPTMWQQAQQQLPALQTARAKVAASEQYIALQQREALPTPAVGVSRVRNRPDSTAYNVVSVSLELPLFDRKQGAITRAQLEHTQALMELEVAQQQAYLQLQQAAAQRQALQQALQAYEQQGMSQLETLRTMAQDAYRLGQSSILEWLDAMESLQSHALEHIDLRLKVWQADAALAAARGQLPLPLSLPQPVQ